MFQLDVTDAAAAKAKSLLEQSKFKAGALRIGVKNGGCSGMRYELTFDETIADDDHQVEKDGLLVLVDSDSAQYLDGITVDYSDKLNDAGG